MIVLDLTIEGFGPFTHEQHVKFPTLPGLYRISGRNDVQPDIDPNGVGKSRIMEALCWCWFGKLSKSLRSKDIRNWTGVHHTKVVVTSKHGDDTLIVTRHLSPNALTLQENDGEPRVIEQDELQKRLGIDYLGFLSTIMFAQVGARFMDSTAQQQASQLSRVLRLDEWKAMSDESRRLCREIEDKLQRLRNEKDKIKAAIQANIDTKRQLIKSGKEWARQQDLEDAEFDRKLAGALGTKKQLDKSKRRLDQKDADIATQLSALRDKQSSYRDRIDAFTKQVEALQPEIARYTEQIDRNAKDLRYFRNGKCRTCEQALPDAAENVRKLLKKIKTLQRKLRIRQDTEGAVKAQLVNYREKYDAIREEIIDLEVAQRDLLNQCDAIRSRNSAVDDLIHDLKKAKTNVTNPFDEQLRWLVTENKRLESEREVFTKRISKGQKLLAKHQYWIKKFSEARLWILDSAATELTTYANDALPLLGLDGWSFACRTRVKRASGAEVPEFSCVITAPGSPDAVPFACWSGGESQLLRIAGAAGFSELAGARMPARPQIELWDEPTTHMSPHACELFMGYLAHRATTLGKIILLIDHRVQRTSDFSGELFLIKSTHGTRIESTDWR